VFCEDATNNKLHNNNIAISQKVDLIGWTIKGDEDLS
jgi:hypothetical protein